MLQTFSFTSLNFRESAPPCEIRENKGLQTFRVLQDWACCKEWIKYLHMPMQRSKHGQLHHLQDLNPADGRYVNHNYHLATGCFTIQMHHLSMNLLELPAWFYLNFEILCPIKLGQVHHLHCNLPTQPPSLSYIANAWSLNIFSMQWTEWSICFCNNSYNSLNKITTKSLHFKISVVGTQGKCACIYIENEFKLVWLRFIIIRADHKSLQTLD